MKRVTFAIAGYPEITRVKVDITADTRRGKFLRKAVCAWVRVGEFKGIVTLGADDPDAMNFDAVIAQAKKCVDYQRKKQSSAIGGA